MNEKLLEHKLKGAVKTLGGKALKFFSPYETGWPDRIVLMPGGRAYWAEIKTTGKKLRPRQEAVEKELAKMNFKVWVIDSEETLADFIIHVANEIHSTPLPGARH